MLNIKMMIFLEKSIKYTESSRNTFQIHAITLKTIILNLKIQKLPLPLMKLEEFVKNSQTDFAEKCFI